MEGFAQGKAAGTELDSPLASQTHGAADVGPSAVVAQDELQLLSYVDIVGLADEQTPTAEAVVADNVDWSKPTISLTPSMTSVQTAMNKLLLLVASHGGKFASQRVATVELAKLVADAVVEVLPDSWAKLLFLIAKWKVSSEDGTVAKALRGTVLEKVDAKLDANCFLARRIALACHCLSSLGPMITTIVSPTDVEATVQGTYIQPSIVEHIKDCFKMYDKFKTSRDLCPGPSLDNLDTNPLAMLEQALCTKDDGPLPFAEVVTAWMDKEATVFEIDLNIEIVEKASTSMAEMRTMLQIGTADVCQAVVNGKLSDPPRIERGVATSPDSVGLRSNTFTPTGFRGQA